MLSWRISDGASSDTASYELEQPLRAVVVPSQNASGGDSETCDETARHVDDVAERPLTNFVSSTELADGTVTDAEKQPMNSDEASATAHQHTVNRSNSHLSLLSDDKWFAARRARMWCCESCRCVEALLLSGRAPLIILWLLVMLMNAEKVPKVKVSFSGSFYAKLRSHLFYETFFLRIVTVFVNCCSQRGFDNLVLC